MITPSHKQRVERWLARCAIAVALVLPFSAGAPSAGAQARWVVKLGTTAFAQAPAAGLLARVAELLEREHPGRFWTKRLVDGALARDKPALVRVAAGEIHGYAATFDELVAALPDAAALNAPFAFDNERDADAVLRTTGGAAIGEALAAQGLRLLTIAPCETRVLFNRTRALHQPADASGLSIAPGANPAYAGLATALSMTQVDTAARPPDALDATLTQLATSGAFLDGGHLTLTDHALECGVLVLSQRWIDGLPEQMQKTVGKLARELGDDATKAQRAARAAILERAKALGVEITTLTAKERQAFVAATREARTQLNGEPGSVARKLTLAAQAK